MCVRERGSMGSKPETAWHTPGKAASLSPEKQIMEKISFKNKSP